MAPRIFGFVVSVVAILVASSCGNSSSSNRDAGSDGSGACGESGDACCNGTACNNGLICMGGFCAAPCGAAGQICCNGTACNNGLTCVDGACGGSPPADGAADALEGSNSDATADAGLDVNPDGPCGITGDPCCNPSMCTGNNVCMGGFCAACGGHGEPCCPPNQGCLSGFACSGASCQACTDMNCGGSGEACCCSSSPCAMGNCTNDKCP
jgi:hypothetical protein